MIAPFLIAKALPRWLWAVLGIALAGAAFLLWLDGREDAAEDRGRSEVRRDVQAETIKQVEKANEARIEIERDISSGTGSLLYHECLRSARNPENCGQFLPQRPGADD